MPKLGAWLQQLEQLLAANADKPARERLTLMRVFESLRDLGFDGGYDAVRLLTPRAGAKRAERRLLGLTYR